MFHLKTMQLEGHENTSFRDPIKGSLPCRPNALPRESADLKGGRGRAREAYGVFLNITDRVNQIIV